jgi:tetratricopeptide (TPR) repeat protein
MYDPFRGIRGITNSLILKGVNMKTEKEQISAVLVTEKFKIEGRVHLYQNSRLSDLLNMDMNKKDFLPVTDAKFYDINSGDFIESRPFLAINRHYIIMVYGAEDEKNEFNGMLKTANSYFLARRYDEAIIEIKRALKLSPDDTEALFLMGLALSKKGKLSDGKECFERVVEVAPKSSTWAAKAKDMLFQIK